MSGYDEGVKRDRYGEPIDDLELVEWQGGVAHHRRVAREALPARERAPEHTLRREGLKSRLRAARRAR